MEFLVNLVNKEGRVFRVYKDPKVPLAPLGPQDLRGPPAHLALGHQALRALSEQRAHKATRVPLDLTVELELRGPLEQLELDLLGPLVCRVAQVLQVTPVTQDLLVLQDAWVALGPQERPDLLDQPDPQVLEEQEVRDPRVTLEQPDLLEQLVILVRLVHLE